jgi:hypothetical protein
MSVLFGLDNQAYRAMDGLSYSESKLLQRSPAHFRYAKDHPEVFTPSTAMAFGSMIHTATLEAARFDERYALGPSVNKNTKEWKEFIGYCAIQEVLPCTEEDRAAAFACAASVRAHPEVGPLLADGDPEVSFFWEDKATGVPCKGRIDWVHHLTRRALILDLKSTQDAGRIPFARSVVNFQYHRQADWYEVGYAEASGLEVSPMLFVVVETAPPYLCAAYTLDRWFMAQAAKTNQQLRSLYKHCIEFNEWPGYDPAITDLSAPRYALDEELRDQQREQETYA